MWRGVGEWYKCMVCIPLIQKRGAHIPRAPLPVVMAVEWVHRLRFWLLGSLESALTKQLCHLAYRLITAKLSHRLRFDMLITILQKQCVCLLAGCGKAK